jgi:toxin HigB-1
MIQGFATAETELLFRKQVCPAKWRSILSAAVRKLDMLDAATSLNDLRAPPGNRLEALKGDKARRFSIRINDRWRICFVWTELGPDQVEMIDYH